MIQSQNGNDSIYVIWLILLNTCERYDGDMMLILLARHASE